MCPPALGLSSQVFLDVVLPLKTTPLVKFSLSNYLGIYNFGCTTAYIDTTSCYVYILCHKLSGSGSSAAPGAAAQLCSTYVLCMVGLVKPDFCSIDVR